jgi:hypothetical protein
MDKNYTTSYFLILLDFTLLNIAFFSLNYWKRGTINLTDAYGKLLIIFYIVWILVSIFTKKFKKYHYNEYSKAIAVFLKASIYSMYFIALILVISGMGGYSRLHVFGSWALLFFAEAAIFNIFEIIDRNKSGDSIFLLFSDFCLLIFSFFIMNYYKRGTLKFNPEYEKILLILIGVWFAASLITKKFNKSNINRNYFIALASCTKAAILMAAIMSILVFAFHLFYFSRLQIYGSIILLFIGETFLYFFFSTTLQNSVSEKDIESIEEVKEIFAQEDLPISNDPSFISNCPKKTIANILKNNYLIDNQWLYDFIKNNVDLTNIAEDQGAVLSTFDIYNVKTISSNSLKLFVNLHKLNDFRWLNRYFLEVHKKLINGGFFVGRSHTLLTNKKHIYNKYPKYFRNIMYAINFVFYRVVPILPGTKRIYFSLTKGKRRLISRAEILGRLHFCGFKLIGEKEHNRRYYFVAKKMKTVSMDTSPSYGPIVKLKRYGAENKIIYTYKLRTMYPYSEFIQKYLYQNNNLKRGGKFNNDFRISTLGRILRKVWIDELPMSYNWMKGDLKIVGVRPLSPHYYSLYDSELIELRKKVKPGLIPPFYADLPETLDQICESEKKYIQAYLEKPIKTQLIYLGRALYNIIIKGARSN